MKKLSTLNIIFLSFISWRLILFVIAFLSVYVIKDFGGRFPYYNSELIKTGLPYWVWGFGNFDGVHYLRIAKEGYESKYSQAFFPLYPLLVHYLSFGKYLVMGLLISSISFLGALFLLFKLFKLDFSEKVSIRAIWLLISFPAAFYFAAVYSESLFLLFCVSSVLMIRHKKYLYAGILACLATATRVVGVALIPMIIVEFLYESKINTKKIPEIVFSLIVGSSGLLLFMFFLYLNYQDPTYFLHIQSEFGAQRSNLPIVLLPQVVVRYIKILSSVPFLNLSFLNALVEFLLSFLAISLLIVLFKKMRLSYWIFTAFVLIIPTLTGTLSSMPRYILMGFLMLPYIARLKDKIFYAILMLFFTLQILLLVLFIRGYWVA